MATQSTPTVFISYSHKDKQVARRLIRRLSAHGIRVWLDERELQLGAILPSTIRAQIEAANVVLVIASNASAASPWVGLELGFAREHGKVIVPLFIEPMSEHERFRDYLGLDATIPQSFADAVHKLMRDLFRSSDLELPPADPAVLEAELRDLAREEADLAPLILGCLDSQGLHRENLETVFNAAFHPLDEALNALFDLEPAERIAYHAAYGFRLAGAGARALSLWIASTGNGTLPLVNAVGQPLEPALIPTAIKLLGECIPPNNQALYGFIDHNAPQLDQEQRRLAIRLATWPVREDTGHFGDVLGWVAFRHFPDAVEIQRMWIRWIQKGAFDSKPGTPRKLAQYLANAHKEKLPGWEPINEALRSHVREYLRSGDENKVWVAIDHLQAVADAGAPVLASLLGETAGVSGTWEWNQWRERDPEKAEKMGWYVFAFEEEAAADRDWTRALESAEKMMEFEKKRKQIRAKDKRKLDKDE